MAEVDDLNSSVAGQKGVVRRTLSRRHFLALLSGGVLYAAAGCPAPATPPAPAGSPAAGQPTVPAQAGSPTAAAQTAPTVAGAGGTSLRIVTFPGPNTHTDFVVRQLAEFVESQGGTLDTILVPFAELQNKVTSTIIAQDTSVDLFYVDAGFFPMVVGGLQPLNSFIERDGIDLSVVGEQLVNLYSKDGERYVLPVESDSPFLVYRSDLYDNPDEQAAYQDETGQELRPPTTFDELVATSQFWTRRQGEPLAGQPVAQDFYGCALSGRTYISTTRMWEIFLHGYGGQILGEDLHPQLTSEAAQQALQLYTDLELRYQVTPPGMTTIDAPGQGVLLNQGRAAQAVTYPSGIPSNPLPGITFDAVPFYEATEKAWGVGISRASRNMDFAWEAMKSMWTREKQLEFGRLGAEPTWNEVLEDEELVAQRPLLRALVEVHRRSRPQVQIPEIGFIWNLSAQPIADVVANNMSVADALQKTHTQIENLLSQAGYF